MGKKKQQKTKEISVAIAEASSTKGDEITHQQAQPQTPRKRGRPRKIIETAEKSEEKTIELIGQEEAEKEVVGDISQRQSKKVKTSEEEEEQVEQGETQKLIIKEEEGSSAAMGGAKKELPRRRGRRKSKPRKSS